MKRASDFRAAARKALEGKWGIAILVGLVAFLLGGVAVSTNTPNGNFNITLPTTNQESAGGEIDQLPAEVIELLTVLIPIMIAFALIGFVISLVISVIWTMFSSIIQTGYAKFNLNLVDGNDAGFSHLFGYFHMWKTIGLSAILRTIYISLWSLLCIIPGIIAGYSYAMTPYILAEDPDVGPNEAITRSKELMQGNKWRLFCLEFSFIGWNILSALTCGIGDIALIPYKSAARADFYREISCTRPVDLAYVLPNHEEQNSSRQAFTQETVQTEQTAEDEAHVIDVVEPSEDSDNGQNQSF